jgi:hypothetical protein
LYISIIKKIDMYLPIYPCMQVDPTEEEEEEEEMID